MYKYFNALNYTVNILLHYNLKIYAALPAII